MDENQAKPPLNFKDNKKPATKQKNHQTPVNNQKQNNARRHIFNHYCTLEELQSGLKRGDLIQGSIRINPRNYEECYLDNPNSQNDILICGVTDRNRALHGDIVAVKIKPKDDWRVLEGAPVFTSARIENKKAENLHNFNNVVEISATDKVVPFDDDSKFIEELLDGAGESNEPESVGGFNSSEIEDNNTPNVLSSPEGISSKVKTLSIDNNDVVVDKKSTDASVKLKTLNNKRSPQKNDTNGKKVSDFPGQPISDEYLQMTAEVVYIVERKHSRVGVGLLKQMQDKNSNWALFSPNDSRLPRMMVPIHECPPTFLQRPQDFEKMLFIARIVQWDEYSKFAKGSLCRSLGEAGEIEPETEGMLARYDVNSAEFSDEVLDCLPRVSKEQPWTIPEEEFKYRRDFRNELLFTIDPTTARDLDDALHVKDLGNGLYEIGVHIADVSFFVLPETELDCSASSRATSVYLVHKVIPMLPRLLCEELCSLNPGVDRLSFSVVWKMSAKGAIYEEWFGRSVIRSCCKLTYDVAQGFIQEPTKNWSLDELPQIFNNRTPEEIGQAVRILHEMAVHMRQRRHDSGALRLDQPKLSFSLNKETGLPNGCTIYQLKDSNRLIEEFMLLANMAVAHRIYKQFPETAVLRRHPPPKVKVLNETVAICKEFGFNIDPSSSTTLQASLRHFYGHSEKAMAAWSVLMQLISKPMNLALYFCSGALEHEEDYRHYALNVPLYTHFTSPIRRYPDVMVHRLLAASLGYSNSPSLSIKEIDRLTKHCNEKKINAKAVSDLSAEMFFAIFVKNCGPIEERGVVMGVMDHSLDVLIIRFGLIKRVYCNKLKSLKRFLYEEGENQAVTGKLGLYWSSGKIQVLRMFDLVDLVLSAGDEPLKYDVRVQILKAYGFPPQKLIPFKKFK